MAKSFDCPPEKIAPMKDMFERLLAEINNIGKFGNTQVRENLSNIFKGVDDYCLIALGDMSPSIKKSAWFISDNMPKAIARLQNTKLMKECVPHLENLIRFLNEEYDPNEAFESESEYESESESEYDHGPEPDFYANFRSTWNPTLPKKSLFPTHKYLNLSDKSEFPAVKSKYRELSLTYHPDKCPNDKTPGMDKSQCETEFKILNNEYNTIKEELNIVGGRKRKTRRSSRKSYKKKSNTKKSMSKKNRRKNTRKNTRKIA